MFEVDGLLYFSEMVVFFYRESLASSQLKKFDRFSSGMKWERLWFSMRVQVHRGLLKELPVHNKTPFCWLVVCVPLHCETQLCSPLPVSAALMFTTELEAVPLLRPPTAPIAPWPSSHLMWLAMAPKSSKSCWVLPSRSALQWLHTVVSKRERGLCWESGHEICHGIHERIFESQAGGRDGLQAFL